MRKPLAKKAHGTLVFSSNPVKDAALITQNTIFKLWSLSRYSLFNMINFSQKVNSLLCTMHWVSFCVISRVLRSQKTQALLDPTQEKCQGCHKDCSGATGVFDSSTSSDQHLFTMCLLAGGLIWQHLVTASVSGLPGLLPLTVTPGHTVVSAGRWLLVGIGVLGSAGRGRRWGSGSRAGIGRNYNRVWKGFQTFTLVSLIEDARR